MSLGDLTSSYNHNRKSGPARAESTLSLGDGAVTLTSDESLYEMLKERYEADGLPSSLADNAARMYVDNGGTRNAVGGEQYTQVLTYWGTGLYKAPSMSHVDGFGTVGINHQTGAVTSYDQLQGENPGLRIPGPTSSTQLPMFSQEEFAAITGSGSTGPGRRGSGRGAAGPVFDEAYIARNITEMWRGYLLEEPGDVNGEVSKYIAAAKGAARKGQPLDFETFVIGRIRKTGRYKTLYGKKPESMNEQTWLAQYLAPVRALGLRESKTSALVTAGAQSGAGAAGFTEGLSRRSEVIAQNRGSFSQRFAQQMASVSGT